MQEFPSALSNDGSGFVNCPFQVAAEINKQLGTLFGYMVDVRRERRKGAITAEEYSSSLKSLRFAVVDLLEIREIATLMRR